MGSPTSAVTAAATPVAAAAAPVAAAIAAAPVATARIGAAWIVPRGSLAAIVVTANEVVSAPVRGCRRFGGWIDPGIALSDTTVATRELVVKPVAGKSSAKSSEHAREETAAGGTVAATISSRSVTWARPHSGPEACHPCPSVRNTRPGSAEDPAQDTEEHQHSEDSQADGEESTQTEFRTVCLSSPGSRNPRNCSPEPATAGASASALSRSDVALSKPAVKMAALEFAGERIANLMSFFERQERIVTLFHQQRRENVVILGDQQVGTFIADLPGSPLGKLVDRLAFF